MKGIPVSAFVTMTAIALVFIMTDLAFVQIYKKKKREKKIKLQTKS